MIQRQQCRDLFDLHALFTDQDIPPRRSGRRLNARQGTATSTRRASASASNTKPGRTETSGTPRCKSTCLGRHQTSTLSCEPSAATCAPGCGPESANTRPAPTPKPIEAPGFRLHRPLACAPCKTSHLQHPTLLPPLPRSTPSRRRPHFPPAPRVAGWRAPRGRGGPAAGADGDPRPPGHHSQALEESTTWAERLPRRSRTSPVWQRATGRGRTRRPTSRP